jgi:hypothetical protein
MVIACFHDFGVQTPHGGFSRVARSLPALSVNANRAQERLGEWASVYGFAWEIIEALGLECLDGSPVEDAFFSVGSDPPSV